MDCCRGRPWMGIRDDGFLFLVRILLDSTFDVEGEHCEKISILEGVTR